VTDLVVRQMPSGAFAIGSFGYVNRKSLFIPRDGVRFDTRAEADNQLAAEKRGPLIEIATQKEITIERWDSSHVFLAKFADGSVSIKTLARVEYRDGSKPVSPIQPSEVAQRIGGVMV
jgi:hypothetical protein